MEDSKLNSTKRRINYSSVNTHETKLVKKLNDLKITAKVKNDIQMESLKKSNHMQKELSN